MPAVKAPTTSVGPPRRLSARSLHLKEQRGLDLSTSARPKSAIVPDDAALEEAGLPVAVLGGVDSIASGDGGVVAARPARTTIPDAVVRCTFAFFERLRVRQMPVDTWNSHRRGPVPDPAGERVERTEVEVPPILVGLAAVEDRGFQDEGAVVDGGGHDAERDVRRIERVVATAARTDSPRPRRDA